jgi:hypothetical protein
MGTLVTVHVYDVTNSSSDTANSIIIGLNKMFKDTMSLGGVFHCGVEVNMEEWSFGYCEQGTGVSLIQTVVSDAASCLLAGSLPLQLPLAICGRAADAMGPRCVQVYSCKPKTNTMYTFRESIPVGVTSLSPYRVRGLSHLLSPRGTLPGVCRAAATGGDQQLTPLTVTLTLHPMRRYGRSLQPCN